MAREKMLAYEKYLLESDLEKNKFVDTFAKWVKRVECAQKMSSFNLFLKLSNLIRGKVFLDKVNAQNEDPNKPVKDRPTTDSSDD